MDSDRDVESPPEVRIQQRHLWEQIAEELRRAIHSGELEPGSRLITADLAARWGVSRGPVREALMALENEGIVRSTRRHGTVVGTPSALDLQEIFSVREAIEMAAGGVLCGDGAALSIADLARLTDKLDSLDRARERGDTASAIKYDFAFHQAIVDLAGNSRFTTINQQMISQNTQHLKGLDPHVWPQVGWESMRSAHRAILDALVARDGAAYREAVFVHYRNARQRASMPRTGSGPADAAPTEGATELAPVL